MKQRAQLRIAARASDDKQLDLFDTERLRPQASALAQSGIENPVKPVPDAVHPSTPMTALPTIRAAQLADVQANEPVWMIEGLWSAEAVGIIGGEPKSFKTFLALDLAVAVATGAPCLRRFPTHRTGAVLLYAAEDSYSSCASACRASPQLPASISRPSTSISSACRPSGSIAPTTSGLCGPPLPGCAPPC